VDLCLKAYKLSELNFFLILKVANIRCLYEYCEGKHWILYWIQENKTATYFLRSRLFTYDITKISTAISIKHRILATFNIKKKFNSDSLYAFKHKSTEVINFCFNHLKIKLFVLL
jgi:hypothetical protein